MEQIEVINHQGKVVKKLSPGSAFWEVPLSRWNISLANRYYLANQRQGTKKTKNKGEVSGGGAKPWRQKGTGRARSGSIRNPHFRGGGVAFGPTGEENYSLDINKKFKKKVFQSLLGEKNRQQEVIVVENINLDATKKDLIELRMQRIRELVKGEFKGEIKEEAEKALKTDTLEGYRMFGKKINDNTDLYKELVRQKGSEKNSKQFLNQLEKLIKETEKLQLVDSYKTKITEIFLVSLLYKDLKAQIEELKKEIKDLKTIQKKTAEQEKQLIEKEKELARLKKKMRQKGKTLVILAQQEKDKEKITHSFRNLPYVNISDSNSLNFQQVLSSNYLVFTQSAFSEIEKRLS